MKKFNYEAKDGATNQVVKATVQADTEHAAAKLLMSQGFAPLEIKEIKEDGSILERLSGRITIKDRVVFTRQLSTLIGAGLPLSQSLRTVLEQTPNTRLKNIVQDLITSIEGGKSLHESFSKHPEVFDKLFLALVAAGEASGTLDDSLQRVATQQEKDAAVMSRIRGALTYPIIVLVVIVAVMLFMLLTVVPQVEKLYVDLKKELPILTHIMVESSRFLTQFWWVILLVLVIGGYFLTQYLRTVAGQRLLDVLKLDVPMLRGMFRKLYMARFTRTGQTLLTTGVPMLDMLRISSESVNNSIIAEEIARAADKVKGGKELSAALLSEEHIMPLVSQMIKIGEQSGRIDDMLGKTAKIYEDELDEEIRAISTAIEPILMVVLALVAGGMVAAILLPIYNLVNTATV